MKIEDRSVGRGRRGNSSTYRPLEVFLDCCLFVFVVIFLCLRTNTPTPTSLISWSVLRKCIFYNFYPEGTKKSLWVGPKHTGVRPWSL